MNAAFGVRFAFFGVLAMPSSAKLTAKTQLKNFGLFEERPGKAAYTAPD
jgi:hypothetical protein